MFSNASGVVINGGTYISSQTNRASRGMDILLEWVATGAFHNSDELYDAPKCHPHTRVAVLDDIMRWVNKSESARDDFMMWLFGPAGAGKSAIAKRIAEIADDMGMLIATFFFSRTTPTRDTKDRIIATLAYQLAVSIPDTRSYIEDAIERDPAIFKKNIPTQIDTLLIKPYQSVSSTQTVPSKKLIIIDGLDECKDSKAQVAILEAISHSFPQHKLPIIYLLVSRPEPDIVTSFNCNEPLRSIHRRLALDDTYRPDDDIRLFFSDKFEHIKRTHLLRSTIPTPWPTQETLDMLVKQSSGQFIYASTVVKFIESSCHRPSARLNIILGISPPGKMNAFAELDALYNHILSCVDDIQLTLRVISLYVMIPKFTSTLRMSMSPAVFLFLEPGDIQLALINLSSILTYDESFGRVKVLHASFVDFLSDKHRSTIFYIDHASTRTDFVHRILQCVKEPDGIRAGDISFLYGVDDLHHWIPSGQLRSEILNFDLDSFINASTRRQYKERPFPFPGSTTAAFQTWKTFLDNAGPEDGDKIEALDRLNKSFESRLQIYQSDRRLQLLLALAFARCMYYGRHEIPHCRFVDILLHMDDHNLHLVDQDALDLRHVFMLPWSMLVGMKSPVVDGDTYASAALHCMRFLSYPPKYSQRNQCPEMGVIYAEWKETCYMTLGMLCKLFQWANTLPELVQFTIDHDIHLSVQKNVSADRVWEVDMHILAFLSRASVCPNRRIICAIQRSLVTIQPQRFNHVRSDKDGEGTSDLDERLKLKIEMKATQRLIRQRLDQCCWNIHGS